MRERYLEAGIRIVVDHANTRANDLAERNSVADIRPADILKPRKRHNHPRISAKAQSAKGGCVPGSGWGLLRARFQRRVGAKRGGFSWFGARTA